MEADRDRECVAALGRGDAAAMGALYDRYASLLLALGVRILRDRAEAEEVVGDVFWELWQRPERFDPARGTLTTYLVALTRSRSIDRLRARTRKERVIQVDDRQVAAAEPPGDDSPFASALLNEQRGRVQEALAGLSADQRAAIELAYYDGLSHKEIASALKEPLGTVKGRIRLGLIHLRDSLRTMYGGEE